MLLQRDGKWKDIAGQETEVQAAGYTALRTKLDRNTTAAGSAGERAHGAQAGRADQARYLQATLPLVLMQHAPAPCAVKARRGDLFARAA